MGEAPQEEGPFSGLGMDPDDGVLGLEDLGDEGGQVGQAHLAELGSERHHVGPTVVVAIGVHGPQPIGQLAQVVGQIGVAGHGVGPEGVTADFGQHHGPDDGEHGGSIDEGDVGVPVVGGTPGQRVQIENELLTVHHGERRVPLGQRSEAAAEVDLLAGAQVLAPDEDDAVGQQGGPHAGDLVVRGPDAARLPRSRHRSERSDGAP